jgi:hypothetical protein
MGDDIIEQMPVAHPRRYNACLGGESAHIHSEERENVWMAE